MFATFDVWFLIKVRRRPNPTGPSEVHVGRVYCGNRCFGHHAGFGLKCKFICKRLATPGPDLSPTKTWGENTFAFMPDFYKIWITCLTVISLKSIRFTQNADCTLVTRFAPLRSAARSLHSVPTTVDPTRFSNLNCQFTVFMYVILTKHNIYLLEYTIKIWEYMGFVLRNP